MTSSQHPPEFDVAVVGAGLAGLAAALTAHEAGARVVILEASDRIGGRIQSVVDDHGQSIADLGPTWVWPPYQPVVARWLEKLKLTTFEQFNEGNAVVEGYSPQLQHQPLPGQHGMVRISGGPQSMIKAIANRLPQGTIRLGARVSGINQDHGDGLCINLENEHDPVIAKRVILAVPLRVAADAISIPSISQTVLQRMRETPTWMATQTKVVVLYGSAFWKAGGLSGRIASQLGPLGEVHDHCAYEGQPALFGFVGSQSARDPQALRSAVLGQLTRCLGPEAGKPCGFSVQDWSKEPLICTDLDRAGPSAHPDVGPPILRQPHLEDRLWLAVSETSDLSPGLIEGALHAGENAGRSASMIAGR